MLHFDCYIYCISVLYIIPNISGGEDNSTPFFLEIELDRGQEQADIDNKRNDMDLITFIKNKLALRKKNLLEKLKDYSLLKETFHFPLGIGSLKGLYTFLFNIGNIRERRSFRSSAKTTTTTTTERYGDWEIENPPNDGDTALTMYK